MAIFRIILSTSVVAEAPPIEDDENTPDEPIQE